MGTLKRHEDVVSDGGPTEVKVFEQRRNRTGVVSDAFIGHGSVLQDQSHQARHGCTHSITYRQGGAKKYATTKLSINHIIKTLVPNLGVN